MKLLSAPRLLFTLITLAAPAFVLSACDTVDDQNQQDMSPQTQAPQPPPPVEPEVIPPLDPQTQIWHPGYWALESGQFVWIPGKIIARPERTAVWAPSHWAHHTYGWAFEAGHWE